MNMKIEPPPPYDNLKDMFKLAILPLLYVIGIWFFIGFLIGFLFGFLIGLFICFLIGFLFGF